jgi:hypothetical protein
MFVRRKPACSPVSPAASAKGSPTLRLVSPQKIAVCDTHFFFLPRPLPCLWETSKCSSVCPTTRSLPAATIISVQAGQRVTSLSGVLGQCAALAHLELYGNSQRFFELRDITSGQACGHLFRHLALLAFCHLFSRQTTRKSDILYTYATYSVVSSAVHFRFELKKPDDKRHDLYLTA